MFKRIVLALTCVVAFGIASLAVPDTADAGWRHRGRSHYGYYYGRPRYYGYGGYYRPYRSYYGSYYRPYYRSYYYGGPRYYSYGYPGYYGGYYGGYYPRGGISFSFGW